VLFDAAVCVLVLCSATRLAAELAAAVRLLKPGGALYYVEPAFQAYRDTRAALCTQGGLCADPGGDNQRLESAQEPPGLSLCAGLLPLICGVCRAVNPDAASERAKRLQRRERARSPVRRRGRHWEVTSNRNVVVVVSR